MTNASTVVFLSHSSGKAGAERSLLTVLKHLDRRCYEPKVVLPADGPFRQELELLKIPYLIAPGMDWWLSDSPRFQPSFVECWFAARYQARRILEVVGEMSPDLIYTNTLAIPHGALLARWLRVPHLWHAREFFVGGGTRPPAPNPAFFALVALLASRVIAVTEAVRKQFPRPLRSRIAVVYNGIDAEPHLREDRSEHPGRGLNLVQVATVMREKGQMESVQAVEVIRRQCPDVHLTMIGPQHPEFTLELTHYIRQHGLEANITLAGYQEDAAGQIGGFDLTLVPSWTEAFSRAALESFAAGVPVIASRVGGLPEVLSRGGGMLVRPRDPLALATAVLQLHHSPGLRKRLAIEALAASEYFTVDRMMEGVGRELARVLWDDRKAMSRP